MAKKKKKVYGVVKGRKTGIFYEWFGPNGAEIQVKGFEGAVYKGFTSLDDAEKWLKSSPKGYFNNRKPKDTRISISHPPTDFNYPEPGNSIVYTDGGALNNPGPGGWGAVILINEDLNELSGGFKLTTNNRMELTACIEGLSNVPDNIPVILYSDSKYVVNGITKGWAQKWRSNNWMRTKTDEAINKDLWGKLLNLTERRKVTFVWVKGHAGNKGNERCDQLATCAMVKGNLPIDRGYNA